MPQTAALDRSPSHDLARVHPSLGRAAGRAAHPLVPAVAALGLLFALTALDVGGQVTLWENGHWTLAGALAFGLAVRGARRATADERRLRAIAAGGLGLWLIGQLVWNVQVAVGYVGLPAPSDVFFLGSVMPVLVALALATRRVVSTADWHAVALDASIAFAGTVAMIGFVIGLGSPTDPLATLVGVAYPVLYLAGVGLVVLSLVVRRAPPAGAAVLVGGLLLHGSAWVVWLSQASQTIPPPGTAANYVFSISIVLIGAGAGRIGLARSAHPSYERAAALVVDGLPAGAVLVSVAILLASLRAAPAVLDLADLAAALTVLLAVARETVLRRERHRLLGSERRARHEAEAARNALAAALGQASAMTTPEAAAAAICAAVLRRPSIGWAAIVRLDQRDAAELVAGQGRQAGPAATRRAIHRDTARYLWDRAPEGPWVEAELCRDELGELGEALAVNGSRGLVGAPLVNGRLVGVLLAATIGARPAAELDGDLAVVREHAAIARAVLVPALAERQHEVERRAAVAAIARRRRFRTVFQPIVALDGERVQGYEALTRFDDGTPPDRRFAEADRVGLGPSLELACLQAALRAAVALPPDAWLSVNVSPALIRRGGRRLARLLDEAPRPIVLEVTEHAPVTDYPALRAAVAALGPAVRLAVDDAGAGFASLRHVVEMRPDIVKLDIRLVRGIDADEARQALVAGIQSYARRTGCELVGEGIETAAERDTLRALGVRLGQGYLFGRPAPAAALRAAPVAGAPDLVLNLDQSARPAPAAI